MIVWRSLFLIFIVFTVVFFFKSSDNLNVDTSLRDLSPDLNIDASTQDAMDGLTENISRSVLFVVSGKNQQQLEQAKEEFSKNLSVLKAINVLSGESLSLKDIVAALSKYRFQLLSDKQKKSLQGMSAEEIAKQAQAKLYRLTNAPLMTFENDPLGFHSEYFSEFLGKLNADLNQKKHSYRKSKEVDVTYYNVVHAKLVEGSLGIDAQNQLLMDINSISNSIREKYQVEVLRSGIFFFAVDAASKSKNDISFISTLSMVGVFLVLLMTFRSVVPLVLPFLSIAFGVAFAFAVTHYIYGKIHVLTIVFGASLIGIVIDYSIHYFFHQSQVSNESSTQKVNSGTKSKLHSALLLSLVTSLLGYLALYFSQLDALKKVAVFSCCGLTMAWLCVVCLGQYSSRKIRVSNTVLNRLLNILKRPLSMMISNTSIVMVIILMIAFAFSVFNLKTSDDPRFFFTPDKKILASEQAVSKIASDYEPGRFVIISGNSSEELFANTEAFFNRVNDTPPLLASNFKSITQWLPSPKDQRANYSQQAKLYGDSAAVDMLYQLLGIDKSKAAGIKSAYSNSQGLILQPEDLNQLFKEILPPLWFGEKGVNNSKNSFRNFILIAKGTNFEALEKLSKRLPHVNYFNTVENAKKSLTNQRVSASKLLLVAYALIGLLILSRYRKMSALKIILVPVSATAALIVLLSLLGVSFNLFHVMALFLVLGLGMDYGIFAYELQDGNVTQQAIFISAITSLLSFGLLGLSSIPVAQSFGTILFVGNSFNLIASLIYADFLTKVSKKKSMT